MSTVLDRESLHQREGGVWAYVSPSRLNLWLRCPLAFKLKYIDGIRTPTTPALFIGKTVHSALERFYRHRQLGIELAANEIVNDLVDSWGELVESEDVCFASSEMERDCKQQSIKLVTAYVSQLDVDEPRPLVVEAALEAPLVDPVSGEDFGIPIVGVIDLVLNEDTGLIADFKTSSRSTMPLEVAHEIQLGSYAYLYRQATGHEESGLEIRSLVKTKVPQIQFHRWPTRTEVHFRRLFSVIREYLDALETGRFSYRPGWGCSMCDVRDTHCRHWEG